MNLFKDKNQINFLKPRAKARSLQWSNFGQRRKILSLVAIVVCLSMLLVQLQTNLTQVSAQVIPVQVSMPNLNFGTVFPGENLESSFIVSYVENGDGIDYQIIQKRKPLPLNHPEYPNGGDPAKPGYYRDLCPYLTKVSLEDEGDEEGADGSAFVGPDDAEIVLSAMKEDEFGRDSCIIGEVVSDSPGKVFMQTRIGGSRIVDMLTGEQLPRIC